MENSGRNPAYRREAAETLALQAVSWLATEAETLNDFLVATGVGLSDLVADLKEPRFQAAVLDFILAEDQRVLALAAEVGINPADVAPLRALLPGGDTPHWT